MAIIKKKWIAFTLLMFTATSSMAHTIYAPNDIPLLDNRFRIDPNTEQVTIILNHPSHAQKVVLVKPDGSKWYAQRHPPESVGWFNNRNQDIITIQNPMPGPWQAIASLNGNNRIQLLNPTTLKVEKLPLKVYNKEYLTSYISLINDGQVITDKDLLNNARLTVSLINNDEQTNDSQKSIALYKDDGQSYDSLPFDGKLSTRLFMDLTPGRYLVNIRTKNNIFIRSYNADMVVFPQPLGYNIKQSNNNKNSAEFTFVVDPLEIDPNSVVIDSLITDSSGSNTKQLIVHLVDQILENDTTTLKIELPYKNYTYSGEVFATTVDGRELSFQLPEYKFEVASAELEVIESTITSSAAELTVAELEPKTIEAEEIEITDTFQYLWILVSILIVIIIISIFVVLFILKRKQKKLLENGELSLDDLSIEPLKPLEIDENNVKK
ncbi:hypothetical protein [Psychromonas sp. SP041]|uniref:hypothetical protein n=1 Tax=Psychromonas sp. SP041 TaxID=1365007 RepID=UPI0010C7722F|nr:hypothetical protein [Psychromonas sp. SP041]